MKSTPLVRTSVVIRVLVCGLLVLGLSGPLAHNAGAALFTLVDDNSVANFDTSTQANAKDWLVDGVDYLFQQAFWFRVGNAGPETSLHTLPIGVQGISDTNFDGNPDTLFVRYNGAGFRVEVKYSLDGGSAGSMTSDLAEQISVVNLQSSPLDFHFFQYNDYDLPGPDSAVFANPNTVQQYDGTNAFTETVITPSSTHREIDFFATTLNSLNDGAPTTLDDLPPIGVVFGPGDITWAFQWDRVVAGFDSFLISKDKQIIGIPEPSTLSLAGLAVAATIGLRTRRRAG